MQLLVSAVLALFLISSAARADDEDVVERIGSGSKEAGKLKSRSELCQECHGDDGLNGTAIGVPHLGGQYSAYILKQLRNFRSGERKHPVMNPMAEGLADEDLGDIAAYFASNKVMQGDGSGQSELARSLYARGDNKRGIPSCKSCHGETGKGQHSALDIFPVIGGQRKLYLREQLYNWRSGTRKNSPSGVMNIIAKSLSDEEIEALSEYISGL